MSTFEQAGGSLAARAAAGDPQAQAELLTGYRERLRRMIELRFDRHLATRTDPSDIVQEAMTTALQRLPDYLANPHISLYPWLRRIAADRLADAYRTHIGAACRSVHKEIRLPPTLNGESVTQLAQSLIASSIGPAERAAAAELQQRAIAALGALVPMDREILVLRYLEQLNVGEIAEVLGISATAVTSRHLRALERLRRLTVN